MLNPHNPTENMMNNPNPDSQSPPSFPTPKTTKTRKSRRNWLLTSLGITSVVLGTVLGWNALAKSTAKFADDNQ